MTRPQKGFIDWLLATGEVVPVTARDANAYKSVLIPFTAGAVLANGAEIQRPNGETDPTWRNKMRRSLKPFAIPLADLHDQGRKIAEDNGISIRSWLVISDDFPAYVVFKENSVGAGSGLKQIAETIFCLPEWTFHLNGNNLAYLPPPVSKARAVAYLIEKARRNQPGRPVIGFGDSLTDLPFLRLCDWWGAPGASQISQSLDAKGAP